MTTNLIAAAVELGVHAERRGVALDPARLAVEDGPHRAALGQPPGADEDQQAEMPLGEGAQIGFQPVIRRQAQHLVGVSLAAFGGGHRQLHGGPV